MHEMSRTECVIALNLFRVFGPSDAGDIMLVLYVFDKRMGLLGWNY